MQKLKIMLAKLEANFLKVDKNIDKNWVRGLFHHQSY